MAKIAYNGMELTEITTPNIDNLPKKMLVWRIDDEPCERVVCATAVDHFGGLFFIARQGPERFHGVVVWPHCAEIPEKSAPRRATWMEVAKWCATGKGLVYDTNRDRIDSGIMFKPDNEHEPIMDELKVRKWDDTEWHFPDVEYMGITEVKTYEDVVKREG